MPGPQMMQPTDDRCSLSTSSSTVDYGIQSRWQLQEVAGNAQALTPGRRQLMLMVMCPYNHSLRLTFHGDANSRGDFQYGRTGGMAVKVLSAQLDSRDVQLALSTPEGVLLKSPVSTLALSPEQTLTPVVNGQSAQGKALTLQIELVPVLSESEARVTRQEASEASLQVELR